MRANQGNYLEQLKQLAAEDAYQSQKRAHPAPLPGVAEFSKPIDTLLMHAACRYHLWHSMGQQAPGRKHF